MTYQFLHVQRGASSSSTRRTPFLNFHAHARGNITKKKKKKQDPRVHEVRLAGECDCIRQRHSTRSRRSSREALQAKRKVGYRRSYRNFKISQNLKKKSYLFKTIFNPHFLNYFLEPIKTNYNPAKFQNFWPNSF